MTEWRQSSVQNIKSDADPADQHELFVNRNCAKYLNAVGTMLWPQCLGVPFCQCHLVCTVLAILESIFHYLGRQAGSIPSSRALSTTLTFPPLHFWSCKRVWGLFWGGGTKKYWRNGSIQPRASLSLGSTGNPLNPTEKSPLLRSGLKSRTKAQDILQHFSSILLTGGCFWQANIPGRVTDNAEQQET